MEKIDKDILNMIQSSFPITSRPYRELGKRLNIPEKDVFERVGKLRKKGIIRRIGGSFHSKKLNFTSTLCAAKVPSDKIEKFVEAVNEFPGVTHNYLRKNDYNIWFTFIAKDMNHIEKALSELMDKTGVRDVHSLPAVDTFKIKVDFKV